MFKSLKLLAIGSVSVLLIYSGCKKDEDPEPKIVYVPVADTTTNPDKQAPTLVLNGDQYVQLSRNASFDDPGAFAEDDVDGNISNRIVVTSDLDSSKFGLYNIIYSVSDAAGNAAIPVVRNIEVSFGRDDFLGSFELNAPPTCTLATQLNSPIQIVAGSSPNEIIFSDVLALLGGDVPAKINGRNFTIVETTLQIFMIISGNGSIDEDGNVITMTITIENTLPILGSTETCTITYTRL